MHPTVTDRDSFLQNLRISKLLTTQQFRMVIDRLGHLAETREIAKALVAWKLLTRFQAKMLMMGRNSGFFIGPYRILDQVGQGGMGRVYKAIHQTMNRTVALKVLAPQMVSTERAHQLFLREVQAAAQLTHPNIVMAFDANQSDGRHYLAMEFVDGPNLEHYVRKNGPLPVGLACEIIFQAANGLQHAFEKRMVHRDIKPANLLLHHDTNSNAVHVKILDFGLARLEHVEKAGARTIVAKQNSVMGTPDFLSPEQSRNLHETDIRSDLYGLGCTFYYLLTGKVPFPGGTTVDKVIRHHQELAPPVEELRPETPKAIGDIVRKLMAKKPADRFQNPDELMDTLAPHTAPNVKDWPIAAPADRLSDDDVTLAEERVDTEPRAQTTAEMTDHESILDWANQTRRHRRARRAMVYGAGLVVGVTAIAAAAWTVWYLTR